MIILAIVLILLILGILYYLFPFIQVCGDSMYPTYKDGEIVIGSRLFLRRNIKRGNVIVYRSPDEGRIVIKRITMYTGKGKHLLVYCEGDNSEHSYDSRHYGYVPCKNIVCKVIRYRRKIDN